MLVGRAQIERLIFLFERGRSTYRVLHRNTELEICKYDAALRTSARYRRIKRRHAKRIHTQFQVLLPPTLSCVIWRLWREIIFISSTNNRRRQSAFHDAQVATFACYAFFIDSAAFVSRRGYVAREIGHIQGGSSRHKYGRDSLCACGMALHAMPRHAVDDRNC